MWVSDLMKMNVKTLFYCFSDRRIYTIRYTTHYVSNGNYRYVNATSTRYLIEGLRPNTQYEFSIKLVMQNRQSEWSMSAFNSTFADVPSSPPRDLTVVRGESPTSVRLNWQPPRQVRTSSDFYEAVPKY